MTQPSVNGKYTIEYTLHTSRVLVDFPSVKTKHISEYHISKSCMHYEGFLIFISSALSYNPTIFHVGRTVRDVSLITGAFLIQK